MDDTQAIPPQESGGRHRADTEPSTGPLFRVGLPSSGIHQEDDLEPRRWPWVLLAVLCVALAAPVAYASGRGSAPHVAVVATMTPSPSPQPTVTVTTTRTARPRPRPAVTVTAWTSRPVVPVPATTVYRSARPRPAVTVTETYRACFLVNPDDDVLGEFECP